MLIGRSSTLAFLLLSFGIVLGEEADIPQITSKNGILYNNGQPCFLAGVMLGPKAYPKEWWRYDELREKFKDDPAYKAILNDPLYLEYNRENFKVIGITSIHPHIQDWHVYDIIPLPPLMWEGNDSSSALYPMYMEGEAYLSKQMDGLPMVLGCGFTMGGYNGGEKTEAFAKKQGLSPTILQRYPDGTPVGGFSSLCFEDPLGKRVMKEMWQRGARHFFENGGNIYAYEMINENSGAYFCACPYNKDLFIKRLKEKYKDIAGLNKVWGTDYESFKTVLERMPGLGKAETRIKGLSVEWEKFLEDRYIETLQEGGEGVHQVEDELKKPHGLIGQMGYPLFDCIGFGGADMYKMARKLDIIEIEAGVGFGAKYSGEVNRLTAVLAEKGKYRHQFALDLADAVSPDKPIINTEHYVIRFKGEARLPTTKADIITSLWEEFLRGVSASYTYQWAQHRASKDDALAFGRTQQALLSPYVYPRESLNGFKEVQDEISRVADVLMERPRLGRNAESAILFSRPTARYLLGVSLNSPTFSEECVFYRAHLNFYNYMMENHYPSRFLYEEQLPGNINKYRLIFAPNSDAIYPDTLKYLADYVQNGGTVVCFGNAFRYDEYGNEKDSSVLLGLIRQKVDTFVKVVELKGFGSIKVVSKNNVVLSKAKALVNFPNIAAPFITVNSLGKGKVYYINLDLWRLDDNSIKALMGYLVQQVKLKAPLEVISLEGMKEESVEAHVIDRGNKKVVFLVNWKPYQDRVVKVKLRGVGDGDKYYLADVPRNAVYTKNGQEIFSSVMLKEGINLLLPAEERVVLLLTSKKSGLVDKKIELMDDKQARELDIKLKEKPAMAASSVAGITRKITFTANWAITSDQLKECMRSAAGTALKDIELSERMPADLSTSFGPGWDRLIYILKYEATLKAEEVDSVQAKIADALGSKYKAKILQGAEVTMWKSQTYKVQASDCQPLDIRIQANMGFTDKEPDDQKGGLFDEGRSINMLIGKREFAGVPFDIIDPNKNNGVACIVLKGKTKPYFPERVEGIRVNQKVKNIYVLHTASYCNTDDVVYRLRLNYDKGDSGQIDVWGGKEIKDWFSPLAGDLTGALVGWQGAVEDDTVVDDLKKVIEVGIYCARLANPDPTREVKTIDLISNNLRAVPAIFGITVENSGEKK